LDKILNGSRFVCTSDLIGLHLEPQPDKSIVGRIVMQPDHEGPPLHLHGGASASLIDEAMGVAVWYAGYRVVAVNLNFSLKAPVPLGIEITVSGWVERAEGRKVFTAGKITLPNGVIAVEGQGIFIEAPHLFDDHPDWEALGSR